MKTWKWKREQDLKYVFEDPDDIKEAALIAILLLEQYDNVTFHMLVKQKMDIPLEGDVPTATAEEFARMSEMTRNNRGDIKDAAEEEGVRLVITDEKERSIMRSGLKPFGFARRESEAGDVQDKAQASMAAGKMSKILRFREETGLLAKEKAESARALLAGATSLIDGKTA